MALTEPGILTEPGPTWAGDLNADLTLIDAHDHTSGKGVQVPTAGLNINANVPFNNFGATGLAYASLNPAASIPPSSTIVDSIFTATVSGRAELFYQDSQGVNIQLTSTGAVNQNSTTPASNGFSGSGYNTSGGAYAIWNSAPQVYSFTSNGSTLASVAAANVFSYGLVYSATGGSLAAPNTGYAMRGNSTALTFLYDTSGSGNFTNTAFQYVTATTRLVVNPVGTLDTTTASGLDAYTSASTGTTLVAQRAISRFGTTAVGQGAAQEFWSNNASSVYVRQAQISSFWDTVGAGAGLSLTAAATGTLATSPGIQIRNVGGTQTIGLGGLAVAGQGVTAYSDLVPSAANTRSLGSASLYFANVYTNVLQNGNPAEMRIIAGSAGNAEILNLQSDSAVNVRNFADSGWGNFAAGAVTANASSTVNGNLQVNGNITATGGVSGGGSQLQYSNTVSSGGTISGSAGVTVSSWSGGGSNANSVITLTYSGTVPSRVVLQALSATATDVMGVASPSGNSVTVYARDVVANVGNPVGFYILGFT